MADESNNRPIAHLTKFLEKVNSTRPCPFCGSDNWRIAGDSEFNLLVTYDAGHEDNDVFATYTLMCDGCGFVRSHAKPFVDKKMSAVDPLPGEGADNGGS